MQLTELNYDQFGKILPLGSKSEHMMFTVKSAIHKSPMRIWVDEDNNPKSAVMWDKSHICYLLGESNNSEFNEALKNLIFNIIIPASLESNVRNIKIEFIPNEWELIIEDYFTKLEPIKFERIFLALENQKIPQWKEIIPKHFKVIKISRKLLNSQIKNVESIKNELNQMWDSTEDFFKYGFGFCTLFNKHNEILIAGWCTGEYFSQKMCGIGIETFPNYQRKGLATVMASAFAEYALASNVKPHWDAAFSNKASLKVAENVGFKPIQKYTTFLCTVKYDEND